MSSAEMSVPSHNQDIVLAYENDPLKFFETESKPSPELIDLYDEPRWGKGEFTPAEDSVLETVSAAGLLVLDDSVEMEFTETESTETNLSWTERVKASVGRKKAALMTSALVTGAVGSWLFEIGPANENLRADVAVELLNQNRGALSAALAVSAITFGVEAVTGTLTAKTVYKEDGVLGRFNKFLFKQSEEMNLETETKDGHKKSDTLLGLAGGSTPVVIERLRRNPERTYQESRKTAIAAAAGIAAFSGALTGVAGDLIDWSIENDYFVQGNAMKETLEDWRTWVGLFAISKLSPQFKKLSAKFTSNDENSDSSDIVENLPSDEVEHKESKNHQLKLGAKVAAGVGFIALGGPQEIAELVNDWNVTHNAGEWLADNQAIDTAEDYASVMWDWRIYTAGFGALLAANRLTRAVKERNAN